MRPELLWSILLGAIVGAVDGLVYSHFWGPWWAGVLIGWGVANLFIAAWA